MDTFTSSLVFRPYQIGDAALITQYYRENQVHLAPWSPAHSDDFYTLENWTTRVQQIIEEQRLGKSAYFLAFDPLQQRIVSLCSLTHIIRGVFQACYMGYSIDFRYQGKNLMPKFLEYVVQFAFYELKLNRIMANYMPNNVRSAALLKRLGFEIEGKAKRYLKINGRWEDHLLCAKVR